MRVAFLLPGIERSGGIGVLVGHARRLKSSHDVEVDIISASRVDAGQTVGDLPVTTLDDAAGQYDIALGTWWETLYDVFRLDARHYVGFVQSFEQRFYLHDDRAEQVAAAAAYGLPLHFVGVSSWICDMLVQLHPERACAAVPNGIDKQRFSGCHQPRGDGPLRVLIEGQPELWFKGVDDALAIAGLMKEPAEITLVCLQPPSDGNLPVDHVRAGLDAAEMAEAYRDADVLVKTSRVEGLGLAPVEGFHCGVPCVVTPFTGHEEYVEHGVNGFVCGFDDPGTAASYLDRLATDEDLLGRLSDGALATASRWPDVDESTARLADFLHELDAAPPATFETTAAQAAAARRSLVLGRETRIEADRRIRDIQGSLDWHEKAVELERESVRRLDHDLRVAREQVHALAGQLEGVRRSRAWRVALWMRQARALVRRP